MPSHDDQPSRAPRHARDVQSRDAMDADTRSSRRVTEPSRRAKRERRTPWLLVGAGSLAVLVGLGMCGREALQGRGVAAPDCEVETLRVSLAPEIAPVLTTGLEQYASSQECVEVEVTAMDPRSVASEIDAGRAPDVWVPDSATWVDSLDDGRVGEPWQDGPSLARSPIVLATADREDEPPASWGELVNGDAELAMANPDNDTASRLAYYASRGEREIDRDTAARLIVLSRFAAASAQQLLTEHDAAEDAEPFPVAEQALAQRQGEGAQGSALTGVIPTEGTPELDYPWLVNPDSLSSTRRVADDARASLSSPQVRSALTSAGFRTTRDSDGPALAGRGAGPYEVAGELDPKERREAVASWDTLRIDMRMLAVVDVSGSMAYESTTAGMTRFDVAQGALLEGVSIIPAGSQVGGWLFSTDLDGEGVDYREIAPVRRLDSRDSEGREHRERLKQIIEGSEKYIKGDTGLYDSVWAAYQKMQAEHDPDYVNSIVVITDGENDDPGGGLSLDQLVGKIEKAEDPGKHVRVITIGMGEANPKALEQIAEVSGGSSYIAETPEDIERVFVEALLARRPG